MDAPTELVPLERLNRFTGMIVLGAPKPADLTAAEAASWDSIAAEVKANPGVAYSPIWDG